MQLVSIGNNLHELSKPIILENKKKNISVCILLKLLPPRVLSVKLYKIKRGPLKDSLRTEYAPIRYLGGPRRGFGKQGNKYIYFRETREQKSKTEGNRRTNAMLGNREH